MITLRMIRDNLGDTMFSVGERLYEAGRVIRSKYKLDAHDQEDIAFGTYINRKGKEYKMEVIVFVDSDIDDLDDFDDLEHIDDIEYTVDSRCTCCRRRNCEHIAAVLIAAVNSVRATGRQEPKAPDKTSNKMSDKPRLPSPVGVWLDSLHTGESVSDTPVVVQETSEHAIFYIFKINSRGHSLIQPYKVYIRKDGSAGANSIWSMYLDPVNPAQFLDASDLAVTARLLFYGVNTYSPPKWPEGEQLWNMLREIIGTGRARAFCPDGTKLTWAESRKVDFSWETMEQGNQQIKARDAEDQPVTIFPFPSLVYLDETTGEMGPAETGLPHALETRLATAPEIPAAASAEVTGAMAAFANDNDRIPLPKVIPFKEEQGRPQGVLILYAIEQNISNDDLLSWSNITAVTYPCAQVRITYKLAPDRLDPGHGDDIQFTRDGTVVRICRNFRAEEALSATLREVAAEYGGNSLVYERFYSAFPEEVHEADIVFRPYLDSDNYSDSEVISFSSEMIPTLRNLGWEVVVEDSWPFQIVDSPAEFSAGIESSGMDWFSLALNAKVDDQVIDLVPIILDIIEKLPMTSSGELVADFNLDEFLQNRSIFASLQDGRHVAIEGERLGPFISAFLETQGLSGFHVAEAGRALEFAEALEGCGIAWNGGKEILMLGERMKALADAPDVTPPERLNGELRPYQRKGYGWLQALSESGFGGALADDMGLGKTIQALALLLHCHIEQEAEHPSLLIVPTSLIGNWVQEATQFAPDLKFLILHGPERKELFSKIPDYHVILTTYPLVHRDHELLFAHEYELAILDEAQAVKNPASSTAKRIREIRARQRIAITGTPMENNLTELWSLFDWLIPGLLSDRKNFTKTFRTPIEKHGNTAKQRFLSTRLKPFLLRRTKDEVATDLPPKTEIDQVVPLMEGQRALYEAIRTAMDERVRQAIREKGIHRVRITLLDALLKLRQVCCDPALVKLDAAKAVTQSAKRTRLMELLDELVLEGRKVLIFSQFVAMLRLIEKDIVERGWDYAMLHGQTRKRGEEVEKFQKGNASVFLISLKAGGVGLNLTAADTVILYDPWWNPAVERQAMDRAHRIGQDKPVFVHRLIAEGSVEATIRKMQAKKQALADALFEKGGDRPMQLTDEDVQALLAPIDAYTEPLEAGPDYSQLPIRKAS